MIRYDTGQHQLAKYPDHSPLPVCRLSTQPLTLAHHQAFFFFMVTPGHGLMAMAMQDLTLTAYPSHHGLVYFQRILQNRDGSIFVYI